MKGRLAAALLAVSFALAMCQPRLGIVVHRHAGAGRTHEHVGETGHRHDVALGAHDGEAAAPNDPRHADAARAHEPHDHHGADDHGRDHAHDVAGGHAHRHDDHDRAGGRHARHGTDPTTDRDVVPPAPSAPLSDADHHNELAALRIEPPPPPPDDAALTTGTFAHAWHTHASAPFHHAALPLPPIVAAPQPGARLVLLPPQHRGDTAPIPGRSRAPPSVQSS